MNQSHNDHITVYCNKQCWPWLFLTTSINLWTSFWTSEFFETAIRCYILWLICPMYTNSMNIKKKQKCCHWICRYRAKVKVIAIEQAELFPNEQCFPQAFFFGEPSIHSYPSSILILNLVSSNALSVCMQCGF